MSHSPSLYVLSVATSADLLSLSGLQQGDLVYIQDVDADFTYYSGTGPLNTVPAPGGYLQYRGKTDVRALFIGDSHFDGMLATSAVSGYELSNFTRGPNDRIWTGSADKVCLPGDDWLVNNINSVTGCTDGYIGKGSGGSPSAWFPTMLRHMVGDHVGLIRVANCAISGSSCYTWAGEQAGCYIDVNTLPVDGDTCTIGSITYRWKNTPAQINDVQIANTKEHSAVNLSNAINGEGTGWTGGGVNTGTGYFAGTQANPTCWSIPRVDQYTNVMAVTAGAAGNSTVTTFSSGRMSFLAPWNAGSDTSALYSNAKATIPSNTFGVPNLICISLGTNDAARVGYRGRGTTTNLTILLDNLHTDFPDAKILISRANWTSVAANRTALDSTHLPALDALVAARSSYVSSVNIRSWGQGSPTVIVAADPHLGSYGYAAMINAFASSAATALSLR